VHKVGYIVEYSFLFPLVQEVLTFVQKHEVIAQNIVARFSRPTV